VAPSIDLSGVLIPTTTPFDPVTGDVDIVGHRSNLRGFLEHPVRGVVIAGSTGEAVFLDRDERLSLIQATRSVLPGDRLLVAGTGAESTRGTVRLCRDAAQAGADAVLVQPPAYYKGAMSPAVLLDHYRAVADECAVPVILYQVPLRFSTLDLATGLVAELSAHENIVAIKDSRGDLALVGELVTQTRDGFQVLVGNGAKFYGALEIGGVGGILGVANLAPGLCAEVHQAFVAGRGAEAGRLQDTVAPLHVEIVGKRGVPGVKRALDLLGFRGGDPRLPLRPLPQSEDDALRGLLSAAGLGEVQPA
jgi:4-hydroxy-2-oxoglutarate aldolase